MWLFTESIKKSYSQNLLTLVKKIYNNKNNDNKDPLYKSNHHSVIYIINLILFLVEAHDLKWKFFSQKPCFLHLEREFKQNIKLIGCSDNKKCTRCLNVYELLNFWIELFPWYVYFCLILSLMYFTHIRCRCILLSFVSSCSYTILYICNLYLH